MNKRPGHLIFGYGLLLSPEVMADRCPNARYVGRARLLDYKYRINPLGVATIAPAVDCLTYGVLWHVSSTDLITLDYFEGVFLDMYRRRRVQVVDDDGAFWRAFVYIATNRLTGYPRPGYQQIILRAASRHAFPEPYIIELAKWLP